VPRYEFGGFALDTDERRLFHDGQRVPLPHKVFDTLEVLVLGAGKVVDRETFQARLWPDTVVEERNLTVNISTLRKALQDGSGIEYIETLPKVGYRLTVPVRLQPEVALPAASAPLQESPSASGASPSLVAHATAAHAPWHQGEGIARSRAVRVGFVLGAMVIIASLGARSFWKDGLRDPPPSGRVTIAVLPFTVAGGSAADAGLGLGLADSVITRLADLDALRVRPMSAVMPFLNGGDAVAIGKSLQVGHIVEGVVQVAGSTAQVTMRIVDVATGAIRLNERAEYPCDDLFALQDAVSAAIAGSFVRHIDVDRMWARHPRRPASAEAYRAYLDARMYMHRLASGGSVGDAIDAFRRSIALDPAFAPAFTGLARALRIQSYQPGADRGESIRAAQHAVQRALALDSNLAEAHTVLGILKYNFAWDWTGAERDMQRAVDLDPQSEDALSWLGNLMRAQGRYDESLAFYARAREINPLGTAVTEQLGQALWFAGRTDEALGMLEEATRLDPTAGAARWARVYVFDTLSRGDDAIRERRQTAIATGDTSYRDALAGAIPRGYRAVLERDLEVREARSELWEIAALATQLGDHDRALAALERCVDEHCPNAPLLVTEPRLRSLHGEPRFRTLAARMNLAETLARVSSATRSEAQ
jgi:DNA-binding winged helix-turn-helix (wHTH) protein/TolB-like protein